jgi:hypothetical protein
MNHNKFVKNIFILTPLVVLPIIISLGALSATYSVLLSSPQQAFAQEEDIPDNSGEEKIIQQAYATSDADPLPGHEAHQSITILRLRDDNAVYSGRITFTTTQPVEVQILHRNMNSSGPLNIPENFGRFAVLDLPGGNGQVTITNVVPSFTEGAAGDTFAASVPFSGNAVALHNLQGEPFAATYTATADILGPAERVDDIQSPEESGAEGAETEESGAEGAETEESGAEGAETEESEEQP